MESKQTADHSFDYRKELKLLFAERKSKNPSYSLRALARDLAVSPTALHGVLSGERHFSKKSLERLSLRLGWSNGKIDAALATSKGIADPTESIIDEDRFMMIADWVHLAILNIAKIPETKVEILAERLSLDKEVCEQALQRLVRLGFLRIDNGILLRQEPSFGTTYDVPSQARRVFHYKNLAKAQDVLESVPLEERDFLTIVAPTTLSKIKELKQIIQEFRKQVLTVLDTESPEEVYFLNLQLYPVTRKISQERKKS